MIIGTVKTNLFHQLEEKFKAFSKKLEKVKKATAKFDKKFKNHE